MEAARAKMEKLRAKSSLVYRKDQNLPDHIIFTSTDVDVYNLNKLMRTCLKHNCYFSIPLFQRRYCWYEKQWENFFSDIKSQIVEKDERITHSFGRILLYPQKIQI
eukprot:UN03371